MRSRDIAERLLRLFFSLDSYYLLFTHVSTNNTARKDLESIKSDRTITEGPSDSAGVSSVLLVKGKGLRERG